MQVRGFSPPVLWGMFLFLIQFLIRPPSNKIGPDPYWATYWVTNYSCGFQRRSLLGNLLIPLGGIANDYWFIAILSWIATFFLWFLLMKIILRFLGQTSTLVTCLFLTVFLLSPAWTGLLIETIGDPLQLIFVIFICLLFKSSNQTKLSKRYIFAWVIFSFVAILIHEASIFFILPSLALASFERRNLKKVFWLYLFCSVTILIPIFLWGKISLVWGTKVLDFSCRPDVLGGNFFRSFSCTHKTLSDCNVDLLSSFNQLFQNEVNAVWSKGLILICRRFLGALLLPAMQSWVICSLFCFVLGKSLKKFTILNLWIRWYILPIIATLPLWIIGNDWGRFAGYSLMLQTAALFLTNYKSPLVKENFFLKDQFSLQAQLFLTCLLSAICTSPLLGSYRISGLNHRFFTLACICGILFIFLILNKNTSLEITSNAEIRS